MPSSFSGENRLEEGMGNRSQKPGRRGLQVRDDGGWTGGDSEGSEAAWNCVVTLGGWSHQEELRG